VIDRSQMTYDRKKEPMSSEAGQATAEYALVIVAAAIVALALISWVSGSDVLPSFFDAVFNRVRGFAGG
jgi:Flp pilus assembly pilin Flp